MQLPPFSHGLTVQTGMQSGPTWPFLHSQYESPHSIIHSADDGQSVWQSITDGQPSRTFSRTVGRFKVV